MTDPIADMLTRIRNAVHARHQRVDIPASRLKADIAKILESEGFISGFSNVDPSQGSDNAGDVRTSVAEPLRARPLPSAIA